MDPTVCEKHESKCQGKAPVDPPDPLKCGLCRKQFDSEAAVRDHQNMHTDTGHQCQDCLRY